MEDWVDLSRKQLQTDLETELDKTVRYYWKQVEEMDIPAGEEPVNQHESENDSDASVQIIPEIE